MALAELFAVQFIDAERSSRSRLVPGTNAEWTNAEWTAHLSKTAAALAAKGGFHHPTKGDPDVFGRSEYLTLDAMYLESGHPLHGKAQVSYPLPSMTLEFENLPDKVPYDYWKLLCVRSRLRVLVFVALDNEQRSSQLKLLSAIRAEHAALDGEDLLLIGNFGIAGRPDERLNPFVWRAGKFVELSLPSE